MLFLTLPTSFEIITSVNLFPGKFALKYKFIKWPSLKGKKWKFPLCFWNFVVKFQMCIVGLRTLSCISYFLSFLFFFSSLV